MEAAVGRVAAGCDAGIRSGVGRDLLQDPVAETPQESQTTSRNAFVSAINCARRRSSASMWPSYSATFLD